jgi:hypothetical protein
MQTENLKYKLKIQHPHVANGEKRIETSGDFSLSNPNEISVNKVEING